MSITIKHLEGPLAGKEQTFDDSCKTVAFGRTGSAQVSYPPECTPVGEKHLELKQNDTGGYTISLCGTQYVEVDGKEAKDGEQLAPDSVIRLGHDGPTFQVLLPGITIRHLTGRLAGQRQYFDPSVERIVFGRPPGVVDVSYPADDTDVGRVHFSLNRTKTGAYCVELDDKHFVAIDGTQAENGQVVPSGSTLRLANKQGPTFAIDIRKAESGGIETKPGQEVVPLRKKVEKAIKDGAYALAAIAVVILGTGSYFYYLQREQSAQLAALDKDLAAANAAVSAKAKTEFLPEVIDRLEHAVYLVAKDEGGKPLPEATAWAFAPTLLATNAHVTEAIKGNDDFYLVGPDGRHITIKSVTSHPGYAAFASYRTNVGTTRYGNFTPLDLIKEYDVGIIEIDPSTPLFVDPTTQQPVLLELASDAQLESLAPGTAVASAGFPSENLQGTATAAKSPPTLHFGFISSLTDVFMCRAEPANQLLIVHSVPVTGGASGSPLIDSSGKVIGIVNGGNTNVIDGAGDDGKLRMSNAVQINYAQRVDLLKELREDKDARKEMAVDHDYWDKMAAQFDNLFDLSLVAFKDLAKSRYKVGTGQEKALGEGVLDPGSSKSIKLVQQTFQFDALPGHVYGFIADAESGVPIAINLKKAGTDQFLRDAQDKRQSSEPDQAPTAWLTVSEPTTLDVTVWSLTSLPAKFSLSAFTWEEPKTASASPADSQPGASQQ